MTFPTILIFETHYDVTATQVFERLLPELKYDVLCLEFPFDVSFEEYCHSVEDEIKLYSEINQQAEALFLKHKIPFSSPFGLSKFPYQILNDLVRKCVSSTRFDRVTEMILLLPVKIQRLKMLRKAKELGMEIIGVDVASNEYTKIFANDAGNQRMLVINKMMEERDQQAANRIHAIRSQGKKVTASYGGMHQTGIVKRLSELDPYAPICSYSPYDPSYEFSLATVISVGGWQEKGLFDTSSLMPIDGTFGRELADRTREILANSVTARQQIPSGNSATEYLAQAFKTPFSLFNNNRAPHRVDAALRADNPKIGTALEKFRLQSIPTEWAMINGKLHLVIPEVNATEVADKVFTL
jgi:hypothetical protein